MSLFNPKILIVDDTPQNIDVLSATVADCGADLLVATGGVRALELAARHLPDLILLDVMMPGMDGFEVCRRLKADPHTADLPVIFVTARTDDVALGFSVGAADYITKPIQADEVRARVNHQLERRALLAELKELNRVLEDKVRERTAELTRTNLQLRQEINERRYMQDRLNYLATHDFITRLYNRSALDAHASQLLARMQTEPGCQAVMMLIDIDQFRLVNETCGCIAGDELLRQFADTLAGLMGRSDFLARVGGDQFVIVTEDPGADQGGGLARLILKALQDFDFRWNERSFRLAATVAIVPLGRDQVSFDQLMQMADETAYLAKREGRGGLRWYTQATAAANAHRETVNWALVLLDALRQDRFRVFFQRLHPLGLTDSGAHTPLRVEALVRLWDPKTNLLVSPGQFISPAERFHLIGEIDRWMLARVLELLGQHPALQASLGQVTLNLSAISLREPGLAAHVAQLLTRHRVRPDLLCFELTETEAITNLDHARTFMQTLRTLGCRFSLDDFGSGYASFTYLRELPFDTLKIDGLFVRDMQTDASHQVMVRSMVDMARLLEKPVVAEFVETEPVARLLADLGVQWGQGYFFHQPELLTVEALTEQARQARHTYPAVEVEHG
ncbi:diguanylate cyclase (GGDEF)-like protein [Sphaerotilus hippei]|uniref:Diguanylate cyclase (GGDEF)-like protein n=1 Tax=Sphaerotilus hippei TaxID=744406 RepID=A0A318HHJ8_9BURK|nr:EAL domain-containing response regulator [Sphaerotilus hippei]PXW99543.1 diguanylate cyclase (GGDEF)-like protein [Sphaerotilus hippei]